MLPIEFFAPSSEDLTWILNQGDPSRLHIGAYGFDMIICIATQLSVTALLEQHF